MLAFIKQQLQLSEKQTDGCTLREHLTAVYEQSGILDAALIPLEYATELSYIWEWYLDISAGKPSGFGPSRVPPSEYLAWQDLTGIKLSGFELDVLVQIDTLCCTYAGEKKKDAE